jgi:dTDP-4-dehydrorhamnose reductase
MLAQALCIVLARLGIEFSALTRHELDVTRAEQVDQTLQSIRPDTVIQCAAYTDVDGSEAQADYAHEVNAGGAHNVARACRNIGARFVYPSTDYVFDGTARQPYLPSSATAPINQYGLSKLAGEHAAVEAGDYTIVRMAWLYGPGGKNFVRTIHDRLVSKSELRVVIDQTGSPTWTLDAAHAMVALLRATAVPGIYHISNGGSTTWHGLAAEIAQVIGASTTIEPCTTEEYPRAAARPKYSVLDCSRTEELIGALRDWRAALGEALKAGSF